MLEEAIKDIGLTACAKACDVSPQAVKKWLKAGRLPRTEWTKETSYAKKISELSDGEYSPKDLLYVDAGKQQHKN